MGIINLSLIKTSNQPTEGNISQPPQPTDVVPETTSTETQPESPVEVPKEEKTIVLDGPLSRIYTQALNMAYAKEDVGAMGQMLMVTGQGDPDEDEDDSRDLYVYCCDGDELTDEKVTEAADTLRIALDSKKYKSTAVAIECRGRVSDQLALLDQLSSQMGVKVFYRRKTAMEAITHGFRK